MGKYNTGAVKARGQAPGRSTGVVDTVTHEGAPAESFDARTDLFNLAVTFMAEPKFYESDGGIGRFRALVRQLATEDPGWLAGFAPWLRNEANMRSTSVVLAAEYVAGGGPEPRRVVSSALSRADEPAELLAYWLANHGRQIPKGLKRGVADAAVRLYSQYSALKYDRSGAPVRMGDVIELCHPKPKDALQSQLFAWLLDARHGHKTSEIPNLDIINHDRALQGFDGDRYMTAESFAETGWTWERYFGWARGQSDADKWETVIPSLGYMALLRNLRNIEDAGVSTATIGAVSERIADPEQVAKSRQFPYRFMSAWKATGSMTWGAPLETALDASCQNIPELAGRSLVLIDTSGSMSLSPVSKRSQVYPVEIGALFAAATAARGTEVDVWHFASDAEPLTLDGRSVLRDVDVVRSKIGAVGHGTNIAHALQTAYRHAYNRVLIFTDMQSATAAEPLPCPFYWWDLGGYGRTPLHIDGRGVVSFAGFTDAHFKLLPLLERGTNAGWPWDV